MVYSTIAGFWASTPKYEWYDPRQCVDWAKSGYDQIYAQLPDINALIPDINILGQFDISDSLNKVHAFLWGNKEWILIGGTIAYVAWITIRYIKNRPQYPNVSMVSSLNIARLSIEIPKEEARPPNVTLTFCVDTSTSMNGEQRESDVKKGVNHVLESAQKVVDTIEGANIEIAIVGFNEQAKTICKPTKITRENNSIEGIRAKLNEYRSNGGTNIINGLDKAITELEGMTSRNKTGVHTLILLTDGEEDLRQEKVKRIHERLAKVNARLFAIGIGARHKKETLKKIAPKTGEFTGTYIDTTSGIETIGSAIASIYTQAVAVFSNLVLSSSQLAAGIWSVDGISSVMANGQSTCNLGSLSEDTKMVRRIQIHPDRLPSPLDLSNVRFGLTFRDPRGREGTLPLPWRPTTVIDPEIIFGATNLSNRN